MFDLHYWRLRVGQLWNSFSKTDIECARIAHERAMDIIALEANLWVRFMSEVS